MRGGSTMERAGGATLRRWEVRARTRGWSLRAVALVVLALGVAPAPSHAARDARAAVDADDFRVVDCLLPGQVRRLGNRQTYVTPRRPTRLPAVECRVRGGEYVAFDRADLGTALRVWMDAAENGDPRAQNTVGEMYEKGLGVPPDHAEAARWYRRAALQGLAAAQVNLGFLYEKGLGVERDPAEAVRLYRLAAGLPDGAIVLDAPAPDGADREELERLRREVRRLAARVEELESQLAASRAELTAARDRRDRLERELGERERELDRVRREAEAGVVDAARVRELEAELAERSRAFDDARAAVGRLELQVEEAERDADRAERLQAELDREREEAERARREAETSREALQATERALEEQRAATGRLTDELERARAGKGAERDGRVATLEDLLADRERERARLEADLAAKKERLLDIERERDEERRAREEAIAAKRLAPPSIEMIDPPVLRTRGIQIVGVGVERREIVGRVSAPAGLISFHVNERPQDLDDHGLFRATVSMTGPKTRVALVAVDRQGKRTAFEFDLAENAGEGREVRGDDAPRIDFGRFHALVVGNDDYDVLPDLQTAVHDAETVAAVLRDRYGFRTTVLRNANRYGLLSALNELRKDLDETDNLLVYYAGHGEMDPAIQRGYWLPVDADPDNPANWVSTSTITDHLGVIPARRVLVVADSCYSGALTRSALARLETGMSPEARRNWLEQMTRKRSRTALSSGGLQPVLDAGGGENSVFARALLDVLRDNDDVLEGMRLFREVAARVAYASQAMGLDQVPEYAPIKFAGHEGGDFFFVPRGGR